MKRFITSIVMIVYLTLLQHRPTKIYTTICKFSNTTNINT